MKRASQKELLEASSSKELVRCTELGNQVATNMCFLCFKWFSNITCCRCVLCFSVRKFCLQNLPWTEFRATIPGRATAQSWSLGPTGRLKPMSQKSETFQMRFCDVLQFVGRAVIGLCVAIFHFAWFYFRMKLDPPKSPRGGVFPWVFD